MGDKVKLRLRQRPATPGMPAAPWRVLVADDDEQVHQMTRLLLRDFSFEGRPFEPVSARSAAEAADVLRTHPDIPVALIDVVMESPDAGLRLVRRIRDELGNGRLRIILRTGQPGEAPERDVVLGYDVNDYKNKTELTAQKLFTALVGAVRAWNDIVRASTLAEELAGLNASLERKVAERTEALARAKEAAEVALARETTAKRQLRQFLSMMSHEFRTPLAVIDSAAQMLLLRAAETLRPRLDAIRGGVQRLIGLIDTCLADEQLDSGQIILQEQAFDLKPLLEGVIAQHRNAAPERTIRVECAALPGAWGDPGLLTLVFNNLISNALKYSGDASPVDIGAEDEGGAIRVTVRDQGIGIPEDDLPRVFERFHRAGNAAGVPGSGIGLHMARQIVDLHGGSLAVASRVGSGSTFTVRLRAAPIPGSKG
ncbi:MAG: hybrid sensor histidine kinase/response regulator [Magnetospirillum sp.]|nr:hybrid sensor histidine kinase/response regulator [Magnetospirillum sp.]